MCVEACLQGRFGTDRAVSEGHKGSEQVIGGIATLQDSADLDGIEPDLRAALAGTARHHHGSKTVETWLRHDATVKASGVCVCSVSPSDTS
jgi:hypothetical protein